MSASARKRANLQASLYWTRVMEFLESDPEERHLTKRFLPVLCPQCGRLMLGCEHDFERYQNGRRKRRIEDA